MKLEILNTRDRRIRDELPRLAQRMARDFRPGRCTATVVLVDDRRIRTLNRRFRKQDRVTDVLAFPMGHTDPDTKQRVLGEIYVARGRARRQGRTYGTGYYGEVRRLVVHGLLHLLGLGHCDMEPLYERYLGRGAGA